MMRCKVSSPDVYNDHKYICWDFVDEYHKFSQLNKFSAASRLPPDGHPHPPQTRLQHKVSHFSNLERSIDTVLGSHHTATCPSLKNVQTPSNLRSSVFVGKRINLQLNKLFNLGNRINTRCACRNVGMLSRKSTL